MNIVEQVKSKLKQEIKDAVIKANLATEEQIPEVILEMPKDKANGDLILGDRIHRNLTLENGYGQRAMKMHDHPILHEHSQHGV